MNGAVALGSTKLPIVKIRLDRLKTNDPIKALRELFEIFGDLHKVSIQIIISDESKKGEDTYEKS